MFSSKTQLKASVVDSALVVSFQSGKEPRVWRIDMGQFLSAALEIKEQQGRYVVIMKPGSGPAEEVGVFNDRKKAVEVVNTITDALLRGKEMPVLPKKSGGFFWGFLKFILMLFLIAVAAFLVWAKQHKPVNMGDYIAPPPAAETGAMPSPAPEAAPTLPAGVPVPADQAIGGP